VDQFWGRAKQTRYVLDYVRSNQCISLVGPEGIGKTSLLNHVADPGVRARRGLGPEAALFVRLEGQELGMRDQAACLSYFVDQVIEQAELVDSSLSARLRDAIDGRSRGHLGLRTLFRVLCNYGKQPVVTLDDFDDLSHNQRLEDSFFAALRSLATGCQVAYVVASMRPLYELETMRPEASTLCGICRQISLPPFADQESREWLERLLERAHIMFPRPVVETILQWGKNEPWRLQLAGHVAFQVWQESGDGLTGADCVALEQRFERAVAR
jgi:hypothetical protein